MCTFMSCLRFASLARSKMGAEGPADPVQTGAHDALRNAECLGDARGVELRPGGEREHVAVALREFRDRGSQ